MTDTWWVILGVAVLLLFVGGLLWFTRDDDEAPP